MKLQQTKTDCFIRDLQKITNANFELINIDTIPFIEISDSEKLVNNPVVSVAMITYDHESYIAQSIEYIVNQQTKYEFELIIGEDCSNDSTREIVFKYQKKYPDIIRVLISDRNVGARKNLLRVEKACRGKYIAYCEGDDYWHRSDKLQIQIDFLEKNRDYSLVFANAIWNNTIYSYQIQLSSNRMLNDDNAFFEIWEGKRLYITCVACADRMILEQVKSEYPVMFLDEYWPCGDVPRFLGLARKGKVKNINATLGTTNRHLGSVTNPKSIAKKAVYHLKNISFNIYIENQWPELKREKTRSRQRELSKAVYFALISREMSLMSHIKAVVLLDKKLESRFINILQSRFVFLMLGFLARLHFVAKTICRKVKYSQVVRPFLAFHKASTVKSEKHVSISAQQGNMRT